MGNSVAPAQNSFNAGELSPLWAGRVDMAKYGNGCFRLNNFLPLPQGPAMRRSGTRFAAEGKNSAHRTWTAEFIYSEDDSYVLEFGDGYVRFYTNGGRLLLSATPAAWSNVTTYALGNLVSRLGINYYSKLAHTNQQPPNATYWHPLTSNIYEIPSPYAIGDLTNTDGTFRVDMDQTGDVIFMAHPSYFPRKLSRFGANDWRIETQNITNGPFVDQDPNSTTTVYASAATGTGITLTASTSIFTSPMIGTLFLIESKSIDGYKVWEPSKVVAVADERRSDSNVYLAINAATTGTVKPTHREGAKFDGDAGVQWQYQHSGYGIARITAVAGTTATADVVSRIPSQAVGGANATTKWAPADWRSDRGYPALVKIFRERQCFARGQTVWGSVSGDFENFANRDGAETLPDSAFKVTIGSSETNAAVWMVASDALLVGTRGAEFAIREVTNAEVFGPGNIKADEETKYGGRQVPPVRVGSSVLFAQRSGRRLRDFKYTFSDEGYAANDLMVLSSHVLRGQAVQMKFALEPHSIVWVVCNDGSLRGLTYLLEQDVLGWHPHTIGGASAAVESVSVIPSPSGTHDQVWLQVRRTINGQTKRYFEYFERAWEAGEQPQSEAIFSDCATIFDGTLTGATATLQNGGTWAAGQSGEVLLSFVPVAGDIGDHLILRHVASGKEARVVVNTAANPAAVTFLTAVPVELRNVLTSNIRWARDVISGLGYAEGAEVTLLVDGATHPRRTVTGGQITLQAPASYVPIGFPCNAEGITMRIEGGAGNGTAQGKMKRVHRLTIRLHESLGGMIGPEGDEDGLEFRSSGTLMDGPPAIFTGDYAMPYPEGFNTDARIRWFCDQPLPFTVCGLFPQMKVEDRT